MPLGSPLANLATLSTPTVLALERALTPGEQRQLLDAADLLVDIGGRSRDRRAHRTGERPRRKGYRPYRNRAIVYTLLGTGMAAPPSATSIWRRWTSSGGWSR